MTKQETTQKLIQVKLALAKKYDNLAKVAKSTPEQQKLRRRAERFRHQAADLSRQ
jgi:hypothetical protein